MTSKTYDRLKWVTLVLLPALASTYFALGEVWHVPNVGEVVATITVLDTFLGLLIGQSSKKYQALTDSPTVMGDLVVIHDYDGTPVGMRLDPADKVPIFPDGKSVTFMVKREPLEK